MEVYLKAKQHCCLQTPFVVVFLIRNGEDQVWSQGHTNEPGKLFAKEIFFFFPEYPV